MQRTKSIFFKYFIICSAVILISFICLGAVLLLVSSQYFIGEKKDLLYSNVNRASVETQTIIRTQHISEGTQDKEYIWRDEVANVLKAYAAASNAEFFIVNDRGEIVASSDISLANFTNCRLIEASILVGIMMYVFLQNVRATLIPTITVPVVLLGTFAIMSIFGFSINTLTMFGLVLAIGLLVDDAIVVVENVERIIHEENLPPKEATERSMDQITGALIGIALVLSAVFVPMAFFGGSTGVIYRQFSITIVSAMTLSVLIALILTPALCATILQGKDHRNLKPKNVILRKISGGLKQSSTSD